MYILMYYIMQLNNWLQWLSIVILFNSQCYMTIVVDNKSHKNYIAIAQGIYFCYLHVYMSNQVQLLLYTQ